MTTLNLFTVTSSDSVYIAHKENGLFFPLIGLETAYASTSFAFTPGKGYDAGGFDIFSAVVCMDSVDSLRDLFNYMAEHQPESVCNRQLLFAETPAHVLYTPEDFAHLTGEQQENDFTARMVLDGGLSVCKVCHEFEAGLDHPCTPFLATCCHKPISIAEHTANHGMCHACMDKGVAEAQELAEFANDQQEYDFAQLEYEAHQEKYDALAEEEAGTEVVVASPAIHRTCTCDTETARWVYLDTVEEEDGYFCMVCASFWRQSW